ncbi:MAG: amidinotransferase [Alphaproteobacteria bacterium]|nr:amidinotransferase [Alphaproteobacteria bacterium]
MSQQSTRNLVLIEPSFFGYNPETASTNDFQVDARGGGDATHTAAIREFRALRDMLVEAGVTVTTVQGAKNCPDAVFPTWFSTHEDGSAYLYPMLAASRRRERSEHLISFLQKFYILKSEALVAETEGRALEGTGAMVLDRVNRVAYIGLSQRCDEKLALEWCAKTRFEPVVFDTVDHAGKPVYNTGMVLWIGTDVCGVGTGYIVEKDRARVLASLARNREVVELDNAQIRNFCGNAVEVRGTDDQPLLVMSEAAYGLLTSDQLSRINRYITRILAANLGTIETYGGASAGAMVQGLF